MGFVLWEPVPLFSRVVAPFHIPPCVLRPHSESGCHKGPHSSCPAGRALTPHHPHQQGRAPAACVQGHIPRASRSWWSFCSCPRLLSDGITCCLMDMFGELLMLSGWVSRLASAVGVSSPRPTPVLFIRELQSSILITSSGFSCLFVCCFFFLLRIRLSTVSENTSPSLVPEDVEPDGRPPELPLLEVWALSPVAV